jgi:hypothetical protein
VVGSEDCLAIHVNGPPVKVGVLTVYVGEPPAVRYAFIVHCNTEAAGSYVPGPDVYISIPTISKSNGLLVTVITEPANVAVNSIPSSAFIPIATHCVRLKCDFAVFVPRVVMLVSVDEFAPEYAPRIELPGPRDLALLPITIQFVDARSLVAPLPSTTEVESVTAFVPSPYQTPPVVGAVGHVGTAVESSTTGLEAKELFTTVYVQLDVPVPLASAHVTTVR